MIKSSCEHCGEFRATPESVTSWVDEWGAPLWAVLGCPGCNRVIVRNGNEALTSVLDALGSPQRVLATPVERLDRSGGSADSFTLADLQRFRELIETDDAFLRELGR